MLQKLIAFINMYSYSCWHTGLCAFFSFELCTAISGICAVSSETSCRGSNAGPALHVHRQTIRCAVSLGLRFLQGFATVGWVTGRASSP